MVHKNLPVGLIPILISLLSKLYFSEFVKDNKSYFNPFPLLQTINKWFSVIDKQHIGSFVFLLHLKLLQLYISLTFGLSSTKKHSSFIILWVNKLMDISSPFIIIVLSSFLSLFLAVSSVPLNCHKYI